MYRSFHGVEICQLVNLYTLNILKKEKIFSDSNFGIQCDDDHTEILSKVEKTSN